MTIAIIGAGMAGLSAAEALIARGHTVRLFDKGRGPGGRLSTRRMDTPLGELRWDHGAQYFTARSEAFKQAAEMWRDHGVCEAWNGELVAFEGDGAPAVPLKAETRYVGVPGMNGVIRHLASKHDVDWGVRVTRVSGTKNNLELNFEDGSAQDGFAALLVAIPAEQAVDLLAVPAPRLSQAADQVRSAPCWAVMLAFEQAVEAGFDGAKFRSGPLAWVARNTSKPGRGEGETWVLHASPAWSKAHLEDDKDDVAERLLAEFQSLTGAPEPLVQAAHRWRYSQIERALGEACQWDEGLGIGTCGDWHLGPRIEHAWQSGQALAQAVDPSLLE